MTTTWGNGSWWRKMGRGCVAVGMVVAVTGLATPGVIAAPPGNNGTVKVDEQGLENGPGAPNSNDPHIDCVGRVEWYGFDPGVQSAEVLFEVQAPTSNTGVPGAPTSQSYGSPQQLPVLIVDGDGPGGTSLDGILNFDLSDLLFFYTAHPQQGFHVKVTVHTTFAHQGSDVKHKVFWVQPCPAGSLSVDKVVTGNAVPAAGTLFSFTVDCLFNAVAVDLNGAAAGTQASFTLTAGQAPHVLSGIPAGATCTVTETNAQGASPTSMSVNGGAPINGTTASGIVIGNATTVSVLATNTFNTVGGGLPGGGGGPGPVVGPVVVTPPVDTPSGGVLPDVIARPATPPAQPPTEVDGVVIPRQLPRTGSTTLPLLEIGLGMILLGVGTLLFGRDETALI